MSTLFSHFFTKINQISPLEHKFTEVLNTIALKPKTLYFYGKIPENMVQAADLENKEKHKMKEKSTKQIRTERPKTVAIVGSRHNTRYGEEVAYKIAYDLAKKGVVIVSGLAFGIDSIAHQAALDAEGRTVAVLGTPINQIYPQNHQALAREIIKKDGTIISEYPPNAKIFPKTSFLERNRIISGLSDIVVVVEAAEKSGSLNTAAHALEQGKEVFAVPGNITNPCSMGCNKLIKQGANPYTSIDDLLHLLFPETLKKSKKAHQALLFGDSLEETAILKAISEGIQDGETIIKTLNMPSSIFNETTTILEIKGAIRSLGANRWALN
ncbi:DNA-processing protein DprA [Candidatus Saccharibacteria bacterium]|nr:DNA-processing protein DprA [Candidatus Saccharibacteria bacterium]